ncbi:hypothetical protein J2Z19_002058 [Ensifer adhaerens]|uniref:Uncharacterized protein n=1 Tax=Ensifer adhaerens TaxID=106592 RepID=A0ACC5STW8_ENSAD|nr:hypothetical protein [Ensifer adhaerens]
MNGWNKDGRGGVKAAPIVGWKTATLMNQTSDIFLRPEFSVPPDLDGVSALQFGLTALQARALSEQLVAHADRLGPWTTFPSANPVGLVPTVGAGRWGMIGMARAGLG